MTKPAQGALLVLALFAGAALVAILPNQIGAIRLGGVSLQWWCTGVIAPVAALVLAARFAPVDEDRRSPE